MKASRYIFLVAIFLFIVSSCGKEKFYRIDAALTGKWEVRGFLSLESVAYMKFDDFSPEIEFKSDGTYRLSLDVNWCAGSYSVSENNGMECSSAGCTKMCCDSPFSIKLTEMLPRVTSYEFTADELKLNVPEWGWISLAKF